MFSSRGRSINKKRKFYLVGFCAVIFVYLLLFSRYQSFEYQEVIKHAKAKDVWEFVSDFGKMRQLNPTILDFKITADHGGGLDDWKYSVEYSEKLSHWPHWLNQAVGHYHAKKVVRDRKYVYVIESTHKTCFFSTYCVNSSGEFQIFDLNDEDSMCIESVKYQCLPFLGHFCRREVEYQRKKIMYNLSQHFSKRYEGELRAAARN